MGKTYRRGEDKKRDQKARYKKPKKQRWDEYAEPGEKFKHKDRRNKR